MEAKRSRKHEDDGVSLPEDIIFDVLVRLQAKDLCRFRCVSKAWRAVISDPAFVAAQRSHAGRLIVAMFGSSPHYELRVLDMHGNVLRVFEVKKGASLAPARLDHICVDRRRLGATIVDPVAGRAFTVYRNDDSTWSHSSFGAYKVLRPIAETCEVATITDGGAAEPTWRQWAPPPLVTRFSSEHKATINSVLYFMPYDTYPRIAGWNRIAAFDLEREVWMETINGPPMGFEVQQNQWRIALTELKGTLCMVHNIQGPNYFGPYHAKNNYLGPYANIWHLIDYKKSAWVKVYMIRLPEECLYIKPLDVLDDGRILLLNMGRSGYVLQFFNPNTKATTDIMEMAEGFTGRMNLYTGNLLSS